MISNVRQDDNGVWQCANEKQLARAINLVVLGTCCICYTRPRRWLVVETNRLRMRFRNAKSAVLTDRRTPAGSRQLVRAGERKHGPKHRVCGRWWKPDAVLTLATVAK